MKDFFRRLKYYGLGFGVGIIMVMALFDNKGCSWFPSNRVKDNLFNRMIVVNETNSHQIKEQGFSEPQFLKTIQNGSVDFGKSKKQGLDKVYRIDYKTPKGKKAHCYMTMGDESFVTELIFSTKKATKITPTKPESYDKGQILFFPKNEFLFYMDSSKVFQEKMKDLGISNDQKLNQFIRKYGQFSFGDSQLMLHPKPIHGLVFSTNSQKKNDLHIQCIWFKDKIKVYQIRSETNDF
jgi:hypothetical protein